MTEKFLVTDVNFSELVKWLNEKFKWKKSGYPFTISDVQGYIKRGHLPSYIGGHQITVDKQKVRGVSSYSVKEIVRN
jgi:hypothetical protein